MCRMLAKVCIREEPLYHEFIGAVHSLKNQSECGCVPPNSPPRHADGCGLAHVKAGHIEVVRRGQNDAWDDTFVGIVRGVECQLAIGHNRKASRGLKPDVGPGYAHPFPTEFKGIKLAFCHNGGIPTLMARANSKGVTDSQMFLDEILNGIRQLDADDVRTRVNDLAHEYEATLEPYTSLTAFLLSPTHLFAWLLYRPDDKSRSRPAKDWYPSYYTLWLKRTNERVLIASEPIDERAYNPAGVAEGWERLENGQFLAMTIKGERIEVQDKKLGKQMFSCRSISDVSHQ